MLSEPPDQFVPNWQKRIILPTALCTPMRTLRTPASMFGSTSVLLATLFPLGPPTLSLSTLQDLPCRFRRSGSGLVSSARNSDLGLVSSIRGLLCCLGHSSPGLLCCLGRSRPGLVNSASNAVPNSLESVFSGASYPTEKTSFLLFLFARAG